jgi:hypothetical protein
MLTGSIILVSLTAYNKVYIITDLPVPEGPVI